MLDFSSYSLDYIKQSFTVFLANDFIENGYHETFRDFYFSEIMDSNRGESCINHMTWYLYHKGRYLSKVVHDNFDIYYMEVEMILKKGGKL